jgi:hypothetical protein
MFNKNVVDVLSQINSITNSVILKHPQTVAVSESQDMLVLVDVSELDKDSFPDIGLKDSLSDFLNLFKLFEEEDRSVDITGNTINFNSGKNSSCYITDNIALMDAYDKAPIQFEKTEEVPSVGTFDLSVKDLKDLKSASGVFKDLSEIIFTSKDGDINISLGATNRFNAKSNTFSVNKQAETTKEFEVKIPVENFRMLPMSDYTVHIKYNSARNSYRILMCSKSLEGFKILLSVKA